MENRPEVVCLGQAVVDCITWDWEKVPGQRSHRARSISLSVGGDAYNESVILTRLGHRVRLLCGLGRDLAGDLVLSQVRQNGVDATGVTRLEQGATPVADILVEADGSRQSITSAASRLEGYSPALDGLSGFRVLSLASLFRGPLDDPRRILELVRAAKAQGAVVCADTKMPTFRKLGLGDLREALPYVDYLFPNESEAAYYTGAASYEEMAGALLEAGVGHVVVKLGPAGCLARSREECFSIPAFPVEAVDATGGGDNFAAGFISALLHGEDFYHCCLFGTAAAAICVTALGSTAGVQDRRQVEEFLRDHAQKTAAPAITTSYRAGAEKSRARGPRAGGRERG